MLRQKVACYQTKLELVQISIKSLKENKVKKRKAVHKLKRKNEIATTYDKLIGNGRNLKCGHNFRSENRNVFRD